MTRHFRKTSTSTMDSSSTFSHGISATSILLTTATQILTSVTLGLSSSPLKMSTVRMTCGETPNAMISIYSIYFCQSSSAGRFRPSRKSRETSNSSVKSWRFSTTSHQWSSTSRILSSALRQICSSTREAISTRTSGIATLISAARMLTTPMIAGSTLSTRRLTCGSS